ncbi:hypothetical protein [Butyrivibrio fibrisolvens]|nr:hypothetical protein [Butyrivibrio fibrisolvens]
MSIKQKYENLKMFLYYKGMLSADVLTYTQDEIDEMLAERAEEIGYPGK